jgi:hypothetical protein
MKSDLNRTAQFLFTLLAICFLSFKFQISLFSFPPKENMLIEAYVFNLLFALLSSFLILALNRKNPRVTGFAFMTSSAIKFLIFFLFFYPVYYEDGIISRIEFLSFFVPYTICLTVELIYLSKILNK